MRRVQVWNRLQRDDRPKQEQLQELRQEVDIPAYNFKFVQIQVFTSSSEIYMDEPLVVRRMLQVWEAELMECTFRPQINKYRKLDVQGKDCEYYNNRFEQLFLDAESRRRRRVECMQWYPEGLAISCSCLLLDMMLGAFLCLKIP